MPEDHSSKIILITGCSSGFGLLTAARLMANGHRVIATMRDLNKSGALRQEISCRGGDKIDILSLDVTREDSVQAAVKDVAARYGYLDVLVNNAGFGLGGFFEDLTDDEIRQQFEVNYFGVLRVTRAVIPLMRPRRQGKIINISSISGLTASPCYGAYNASKWALEAFSESLRYELGFFGIDVLLVEPGVYKTKIFYENARHGRYFHDSQSPYFPISQFLEKRTKEHVDDCHKDPEEIAVLIEKLIAKRHPAFRNIPDIESQVLYYLRKFLPFRFYSRLYQKILFRGLRLSP
jgi:NAD(P)-dependent dehydrogenase (short-subunit alcohol dehydrogenase family)